jgi:hypothetical protein
MTPRSNRTSLARKRWQERRVQWVASLPSLIHCCAVPRWLEKWTMARFVPVSVATMKPDPGEELSQVMLDLGDHPSRPVPRRGLILDASIPHQRGVAGSAPRPGEQVLDRPFQHLIGREPDGIGHVPPFQCLVQRGERKGRVRSDDDGLLLRTPAHTSRGR